MPPHRIQAVRSAVRAAAYFVRRALPARAHNAKAA